MATLLSLADLGFSADQSIAQSMQSLRFVAYYKQIYRKDIQVYIGLDTHEG